MSTKLNLNITGIPVELLIVMRGEKTAEECEKNGIDLDKSTSIAPGSKNVLLFSRSDFDDEADLRDIQPNWYAAMREAGIEFSNVKAFVENQL